VTPATAQTATPAGPGSARVGMVGGGQPARMTHQAAVDLGVCLEVLAPSVTDPAVVAGAPHLRGGHDSLEMLCTLAERCDVLTLDHERAPIGYLHALQAAGHTVRPCAEAVGLAQDKLLARRTLEHAGFPVPPYAPADLGDGRGVQILESLAAARALLSSEVPGGWLLEAHVAVNVIGSPTATDPLQHLPAPLSVPGANVHLYAKTPVPGRELGHVTALGHDHDEAIGTARAAAVLLAG